MNIRLIKANKKNFFVVLILMAAALAGCSSTIHARTPGQKRYERTWESLAKHTDPKWFRDAKPGVYHLVLGPSDPAHWRAVNVYQLQLAQK